MAAVFQRQQIGIKATGVTVTVPANHKAKLMFYLDCVCNLLPINDDGKLDRLIDYRNYNNLTESEYAALLSVCLLISPDILINKCIFYAPQLCGDSQNEFYELTSVNTQLAVADSIVIGGVRQRVHKIMVFKESWLEKNFIEPFKIFKRECEADESSCCCTIL